jgi:Uma2 family endonuclease
MTVDVVRRRFTVDEYQHMAQVGILTTRDRVELLDGEIVEMTPIGRSHAACVAGLMRVLLIGVGPRAVVWPQGPIRLSERSQPEPDVTLLRPRPVPYRDADAEPRDVMLLIEVSDTSLRRDREIKLPLYAGAGIHEYWIVDVQDGVIEVHTSPSGSRYGSVRRFGRGELLSPLAFPDLRLAVDEVFGS